MLSLSAGSLLLADVSLTQGRACGTKLWWNNYIIKEQGNVQKQWLPALQSSWWALSAPNEVPGVRGTGYSGPWWGQLVENVLLCKVAAAPAPPQVACFIHTEKKEVSSLVSAQAIAGVGGMPGSWREDPRAARAGTVLLFLQLLHLMFQSQLPEMGPQLGRQKAVEKEGKNMLVKG